MQYVGLSWCQYFGAFCRVEAFADAAFHHMMAAFCQRIGIWFRWINKLNCCLKENAEQAKQRNKLSVCL